MISIKKIKGYFEKRRKKIRISEYNAGYDYASGTMLRREKTPLNLEAEIYPDNSGIDSFDFDSGINAAIDRLVKLGIIEDDRII